MKQLCFAEMLSSVIQGLSSHSPFALKKMDLGIDTIAFLSNGDPKDLTAAFSAPPLYPLRSIVRYAVLWK